MKERTRPLAVEPFGRMLASYTVNEFGDSVGIVALAVLVYDGRRRGAHRGAFPGREVPPRAHRAVPHGAARPDSPSAARCRGSTSSRRSSSSRSPGSPTADFALVAVLVARARRRRDRGHGAGAHPRRDREHPPARRICCARATRCSTSASRSPSVGGSALAGLLISEFGLSAAPARRRASFVAIAIVLGAHAQPAQAPGRAPARRSSASAAALPSPAATRACGCCSAASRSRSSSSR